LCTKFDIYGLVSTIRNKKKKILDINKWLKKSLKIPKGLSESIFRRRTDSTMAKRKSAKGQARSRLLLNKKKSGKKDK
jgi:hypothetical protein